MTIPEFLDAFRTTIAPRYEWRVTEGGALLAGGSFVGPCAWSTLTRECSIQDALTILTAARSLHPDTLELREQLFAICFPAPTTEKESQP